MPTLQELRSRTRKIECDADGLKIHLEVYLFNNTRENTKAVLAATAALRAIKADSEDLDQVAKVDNAARGTFEARICQNVKSWDLELSPGKVIELTPEAILAADIPFEIIEAIEKKIQETPIVPEANASP